jgi:hypothetical protein
MTTRKKPPSGAANAIACLDHVLKKRANQRKLIEALQEALRAEPYQFFKTVILPLLPKPLKIPDPRNDAPEEPLWTPLCDIIPMMPKTKSTTLASTDSAPSAAAGDSGRPSASPRS